MNLRSGLTTDVGRKRQQNQDNAVCAADLNLFIVADGMGGHQGGATASQMAVELIPTFVREKGHRLSDPAHRITEAIRHANAEIFRRAQHDETLTGMGTTTSILYFVDGTLVLAQVGDSRSYLIRVGSPPEIWQLTRDHSLVQEKFAAGMITRAQMKTDRLRNVLTRCVGFEAEVRVENYRYQPQAGDVFLLCSDGLSGLVDDAEIARIVAENLDDLDRASTALISAANAAGGDDNVTALLVSMS